MTGRRAVYLDASALVKLIVEESGSAELVDLLSTRPLRITSRVSEVEVGRAVARLGAIVDVDQDRPGLVLATLVMVELDASVAVAAGRLLPPTLRSLDAIHLASAILLSSDLEAFVTYDRRLADAAAAAGLSVAFPGESSARSVGRGICP